MRTLILKRFFMAAVLLAAVSCSTSPTGRSQLVLKSDTELELEGTRQFRMLEQTVPLVQDRATIDFVACVANSIIGVLDGDAANLYWELRVVDQPEVNAFVLPGGKIVVNSGILTMTANQDQLAAVLGHEVAHVTARHANERASRASLTSAGIDIGAILLGGGYANQTRGAQSALSGLATLGILNPFSRQQETEADVIGLEYMASAGFDPRESVELWKTMNEKNKTKIPEYMSTHPSGETRIDDLVSHYPQALALYNEAQAEGRHPDCHR